MKCSHCKKETRVGCLCGYCPECQKIFHATTLNLSIYQFQKLKGGENNGKSNFKN